MKYLFLAFLLCGCKYEPTNLSPEAAKRMDDFKKSCDEKCAPRMVGNYYDWSGSEDCQCDIVYKHEEIK